MEGSAESLSFVFPLFLSLQYDAESQKSAKMCADPDVLLFRIAEIQDTKNSIYKLTLKQHRFRKKNFGVYFDVPDKVL